MAGSAGYNLTEGEFISTPIENMDPGFQFSQIPDLTMSLWLMDRYFFETTVKEDSEQNTFLMGYQGKEDEFVQSVLIGNTRIDIDDYSFLSVSDIPDNSLGASAAFKTQKSYHELLLRYDPSETAVKEFRGSNEILRQNFTPDSYERGILFILPDSDIENTSVYIESENGSLTGSDKRLYRKGDAEDFILSESEGTLRMRERAEGRILVYYTKNGFAVGSDSSIGIGALCGVTSGEPDPGAASVDFEFGMADYLGQDMSAAEKQVTIEGNPSLLIFNRNEYSPFESYSIYRSSSSLPEEDWKTRFGISDKSSDPEDIDRELKFKAYTADNNLQLYVNTGGDRDMYNRYPLSSENLSSSPYGPGKASNEGSYKKELRLEILSPVGSYYLDPDVIPGSVNVKRNGYTESRYEIDYSSGLITFNTYIHPNDRIKTTYRTMYANTQGGDLLFASGNRFLMGDYLTGELGFGIRWNVFKNQYSRIPEQYPGSILAAGGLDYQREQTKLKIDAGVSLTTPDTTGILRLFDMQQNGIELRLNQTSISPSSVPENGFPVLIPTVNPTETNRGILYYKDYNSYSFGSESLNNYTWDPPSDQIYEYESGNPPGPYSAKAENEGIRDEVMVLEYSIPAGKEWAGSQVPVVKFGNKQDLSDAETITFKIKSENISEPSAGDTKLYLQLGSVSEDLDNDNILDREASVYSNGFPFNDSSNNAVLLIGGGGENSQGNGYLDSEDNDLNEILDLEDDNNVITVDILTDSALTSIDEFSSWKKVTHVLTETQKQKLSNSSSMRFIVTNETGSAVSGKLIIGEISIESSPFKAEAGTPDSTYAREVFERNSSDYPPEKLINAYPEVNDIFFQDLEPSLEQKVLESAWAGGGYVLTGYSTPVPYDMYRKLNLYLRIPSITADSNVTVSLTDTAGKGVTCSFTTSSFDEWKKLVIDMDKKSATLDGASIASSVSLTSSPNNISMLKVTSDSAAGKIYIDEVHFSDPDINISTGTAVGFEHTFTGDILRIGDASFINNLTFTEEFSHTQKDFSGDLSEDTDANNTRTKTGIKTGILNSTLETNFDYSWIDPDFYKTIDHTYTTPLGTDYLEFKDSYSETDDAGIVSFSKSNHLNLETEKISGGIETSSTLIYSSLTQSWNTDLSFSSDSDHNFSTSLLLSMNSDSYSDPDSLYLPNWIKSYETFIPVETDPFPDRNIKSSSEYSWEDDNNGFSAEISASALSSGEGDQRLQTSSGNLDLSFPFYNLDIAHYWQITPSYKRNFSYTHSSVDGDSFRDDEMLWFSDFTRQNYFYTGIPFAEFFSSNFEDKFVSESSYLENAYYTPSFSIAFSRMFGSDIKDLYLPSDISFNFEKEFKKEKDSYLNTYRWGSEYTTRAINLFGGFGAFPVFSFYKTDEFITRAGFQITSTDTLSPEDREISLANNIYFTGYKNNELSLENRLRINYESSSDRNYIYDDATVSYTWIIIPEEKLYMRYLAEDDDPDAYFSHTESFVYSTAPETSFNDSNFWSVLLTHESALLFPEKGNFRALFSVGLEKHRIVDYDGNKGLYLLGLQAGIFGKVMF